MKRLPTRLVMLAVLLSPLAVQATSAAAMPLGQVLQQQEEFPPPTPLDDPYVPPAGDPDIFAPEPSGEPAPDNPSGD